MQIIIFLLVLILLVFVLGPVIIPVLLAAALGIFVYTVQLFWENIYWILGFIALMFAPMVGLAIYGGIKNNYKYGGIKNINFKFKRGTVTCIVAFCVVAFLALLNLGDDFPKTEQDAIRYTESAKEEALAAMNNAKHANRAMANAVERAKNTSSGSLLDTGRIRTGRERDALADAIANENRKYRAARDARDDANDARKVAFDALNEAWKAHRTAENAFHDSSIKSKDVVNAFRKATIKWRDVRDAYNAVSTAEYKVRDAYNSVVDAKIKLRMVREGK